MNSNDMLASLATQAAADGADLTTLRVLIEEASEVGARRVLDRLGLADGTAQQDLSELRQLLAAWRDAKASAWRAAVDWLVRGALALLLVGIAYRLGVAELLR
ncbi:MAG TPA: DUF6127 family protein [Novosphingobium sp.]